MPDTNFPYSEEPYSNNDDNESLETLALKFFRQERFVDMLPFIYTDHSKVNVLRTEHKGSAYYWDRLIKLKSYYIYHEEKELFEKYSKQITGKCKSVQHIVDLGCGSVESIAEKTVPIMRFLKSLKAYTALDINKKFARDAAFYINQQFPEIRLTSANNSNMYTLQKLFDISHDALFLLVGTTITNIPEKTISTIPKETVARLAQLKEQMPQNSYFLVGYDANIDPQSALKAYQNSPLKGLISSLMYNIAIETSHVGFDPSLFKCVPAWDEKRSAVIFNLEATKGQSFFINQQKVVLHKGDQLHVGSSMRYPVSVFEEAASQAGFESVDYFQTSKKRMTLHLLKMKE